MSAPRITRSFAFLDLCGFTAYMERYGDERAAEELLSLRAIIRAAGADHGVRVAKWLGDGSMLVAIDPGALLSCTIEIDHRISTEGILPLRGGVATGPVLPLEADDYVGPAVNVAARLCAAAEAGQILVTEHMTADVDGPVQTLHLRGVSRAIGVRRLRRRAKVDALGD